MTVKTENEKNPDGMERVIRFQSEREKSGRYVRVNGRTMIFVRNGKDPEEAIRKYNEKHLLSEKMWG